MTPTQRAAAERLADELQRFDGTERESLRDEAAALLRELLAEPVQEPVAYIDQRQLAAGYVTLLCITRPEYRSYADVAEGIHYTPVYLHPAQQRKPLTERQIVSALADAGCCGTVKLTYDSGPYEVTCATAAAIDLVRAIERAHGIVEAP